MRWSVITKLLLSVVCGLVAAAGALTAQELIVNGGFENTAGTFVPDGNTVMSLPNGSTAIPGWTTTNAELLWAANGNAFGPGTPYGDYFLDLTGYHDSSPYAAVTQTLPTTPGQTYQVSFALGQYNAKAAYAGPVSIMATVGITNGIFTFTPTNGGANQWTNIQVNFTAPSASTLINLAGQTATGGQYLGLDNVSLTPSGGGPELLANGSFEDLDGTFVIQSEGAMSLPVNSTNIPGWVTTTAEIGWVTNSNPLGLATPYGSMFLDLTGFHDSIPYGGVQQTVVTTPGRNYSLSFSVGVDQAVGAYSGPVSVRASVASGGVFTTTANGGDWQTFGFTFVANSTAAPLTLTGVTATGGQYLGLDNVSVTPAGPLFIITSIVPLNRTNLVLTFNSLSGSNYAVESRADLGSGSWVTLPGTTNIGTGGPLSVTLTNSIGGPREFYRVQEF